MKDLDPQNAALAIDRLQAEIGDTRQWQSILVESQSAAYLRRLPGDLRKILWVDISPVDDSVSGSLKHAARLFRALRDYYRAGASAISMDFRQYDATAAKVFANIPMALFTINNPTDLCRAVSNLAVEIILSDKPFYSPTCSSQ